MGFKRGDVPAAENYYAEAITLPMYPGLDAETLAQVAGALRRALRV
jgi:dTDP-4-amino-4,6-dideoxygalactose transaminase